MRKLLKKIFRDEYLRNDVKKILNEILNSDQKLNNEIDIVTKNGEEILKLKSELEILKNKYNVLLLNQFNSQKTIKNNKKHVLFLIHNMTTWTALAGIYEEMKKRENVEIFVLAIQADESSAPHQKSYSSKTEKYLKEEEIKFDKINSNDIERFIAYMSSINPDYVIRQSPWDDDIPWLYSSMNLARYKLIYIPYHTLDILEEFSGDDGVDMEINQNFHLYCDKIYCLSEYHLKKAKKTFIGRKEILKYFGNTKLENIAIQYNNKKCNSISSTLKILWAPHHSINNEWLAFGTFEKNCMEFIKIAKQYGNRIHIKLRAHPLLKQSMENFNKELYESFIQEWNKLENVSLDEDWNYLNSFKWSDILVTDGVSFIAEYPLTKKELVFIENKKHIEFNKNGLEAKKCCHVIETNEELRNIIEKILKNELNDRDSERKAYEKYLRINNASKEIVRDIFDEKRIGYLSGTFDLFHIGHLNIIKKAKENCNYLIVGVHKNASHKGKKTFISLEERKEIIKNLEQVDKVIDAAEEDIDIWKIEKYDYLFVGSDYKGTERFQRYEKYFADKDVEIKYFPYTQDTSSSKLRNLINKKVSL